MRSAAGFPEQFGAREDGKRRRDGVKAATVMKLLPDDVDDAVTASIADEFQSIASLMLMLDRVRGAEL